MVKGQLVLFLEITTVYNLVTLQVHFFKLKNHLGFTWVPAGHLNCTGMLLIQQEVSQLLWGQPRNFALVYVCFYEKAYAACQKISQTHCWHPSGLLGWAARGCSKKLPGVLRAAGPQQLDKGKAS